MSDQHVDGEVSPNAGNDAEPMDALKLVALDEDDLTIVAAHVQDAVLKVGELDFSSAAKRLVISMNRFAWEESRGFFRKRDQRRKSVLTIDRVLSAKRNGFNNSTKDDVLSLLTIRFAGSGDGAAGMMELVFAGGAAIRLGVECIEVRLSDLGAAWEASSRPVHRP